MAIFRDFAEESRRETRERMASAERDASEFTVNELKRILREMGLATTGVKSELIARLSEKDPGTAKSAVRCHNFGVQGHRAADCPAKAKGTRCREFGHIAANCEKKN